MQLYGRTEETPRHRLAGHKIVAKDMLVWLLYYVTHTHTHTHIDYILTHSGQMLICFLQISIDVLNDWVTARAEEADTVRRGLAYHRSLLG